MAKSFTQKQIDDWQKEALKRRGRGNAEVITKEEAERLLSENAPQQSGSKVDRVIRLLESIERSIRDIGKLG